MPTSSGQIITLQLGELSNYTGAHFWNLQVIRGATSCAVRTWAGGRS